MNYQSIELLCTYFQWLVGIAIAGIILRVGLIIHAGIANIEDVNIGAILNKVNIHIKAAIICTLLEAIAELIKKYYFI